MSPTTPPVMKILGVGIDTARYGHHATFLGEDRQAVAEPLQFRESAEGYAQLRQRLERIRERHPQPSCTSASTQPASTP